MLNNKNIKKEKTKQLNLNVEGANENKTVEVFYYKFPTYSELEKINNKKVRKTRINTLKNEMSDAIYFLGKAIEDYKILYNRTEFWENKSTFQFDFKNWNKMRKVNGKLTKYYNELIEVIDEIRKIERWENED